ncbi:MAG: F0F1 ATP synthase subunit gamma [Candidatus Moranbacteria bacterium GW2011_GWF1_44_4]|nr:MAG: F0F1 ATP synthase subunit gamma [Candidatus Moranbacteria bacterium GW2011_GWF1_44_4]
MMEIVYAIADDRDAEIGDALRSALDSRATPVSGMPDFRGAYEEAGRRRRSRILRVSVPAFAVAVAATATAASLAVAALLPLRSATDAASDMVDNLTLIFNQIRQAGITQEIAEISAGRAALEQ